ncbi:MAG: hypothetical protein ACXAC7_03285 [Candidatus Hodarchaeales archaeon]|jgi:predicted  nucleic acid-binding Zn-ribbon protein
MLTKYRCTKCQKNPNSEREVLYGCQCGNKFFQLCENNSNKKTNTRKQNIDNNKDNLGNISIESTGVYQINVESLFQESNTKIISVSDKKGIIHLNLD